MGHMIEIASRLGAKLGNWNDRLGGGPYEAAGDNHFISRRWRVIDRIASWLYVWPER